MKRIFIASIVGGFIIFIWQFLSNPVMNLHINANRYTPNQAAILDNLKTNLPEEGGYMLPGLPVGSTKEEHEKAMEQANGKPWATVQYHKISDASIASMVKNMGWGVVVDIVTVMLFCWIISGMNILNFKKIFLAALFTGLIVFFNAFYTMHIWYRTFDIMAHFTDAIVSWGLAGLWLGWYIPKGRVA